MLHRPSVSTSQHYPRTTSLWSWALPMERLLAHGGRSGCWSWVCTCWSLHLCTHGSREWVVSSRRILARIWCLLFRDTTLGNSVCVFPLESTGVMEVQGREQLEIEFRLELPPDLVWSFIEISLCKAQSVFLHRAQIKFGCVEQTQKYHSAKSWEWK